jgi:polyhydroxybutyrate depolymerase
MHWTRSWRLWAAVIFVVAAACGDDADTTAGTDGTAPSTPTAPGDDSSTPAAPAAVSPACESEIERPFIDRLDVMVDGTARTSAVHLPSQWDGVEPLPVVLSFHGAGADATVMAVTDGLDAKADSEAFVVLRPEALSFDYDEFIHDVSWWDLTGQTVDEPAFLVALLDDLGQRACIDQSQVFATGFSVGGEMAMAAACALPDRIAAFSQVAAGRSVPCSSGRPTPALAFHGTEDLVIPYDGRLLILPAEDLMAEQAQRNGCEASHEVRPVTPTVDALTWTDCDEPTVLYRLEGHGHAWPGNPLPFDAEVLEGFLKTADGQPRSVVAGSGLTVEAFAANLLLTNTEVNATDVMWNFFTTADTSSGA